jgi:hypothetical protein
MIFIAGRRLVGRVEEYSGTFIVTQFWHINFVPLVPLRSFLVLESGPPAAGGIRRSVETKLHATSVLAGYLRTWCSMGIPFCLLGALIAGGGPATLAWLVASGIIALVALFAWTGLGRLSAQAMAQRDAYASLTHERVDAAILCRNNDAFRSTLHANVADGARSKMTTGYRTSLDPEKDWIIVALDPTVRDPAFVQACFTLARIEWGRTKGKARAKLAEQHEQLWEKLRAVSNLDSPSALLRSR